MNKAEILVINEERMERWKHQLTEHNLTPVLVLALEHGGIEGRQYIVTVEDLSDSDAAVLLAGASKLIQEGRVSSI